MLDILFDLLYPFISLWATAAAGWSIIQILWWLKNTYMLRRVIWAKQKEREQQFTRMEGQDRYQLNEEHERILSLPENILLEQLQNRKLTATQVLEAFTAKSLKLTREINAITEFIPEAEDIARQLDSVKEVKGPLHGLPVTIKDNCNVEGRDSTLGLGKHLFKPADKNSNIVQTLIDLGAVPFAKTNVPQTLLSFGCANPVYGLTKNCLNHELSPGGSSGGEASLIAGGGSIIGVGSDIGGSVRIPGHFCGICALKISKDRLSLPNVVGVIGVPGLLAKKVSTLTKVFKHMVEDGKQNKYDPLAMALPWNEQLFSSKKKLRIGYFTSLAYFPPVGDTEEVVLKAKAALESNGHTLVPFDMPNSFDMMDLIFDFTFADRGEYLLKNWENEPIPLSVIVNYLICKSPMWLRKIITLIMGFRYMPFVHSKRAVTIISAGANDAGTLWKRLGDQKEMLQLVITKWRASNIDFLLTPTFPFPAVPHHLPGRLQPSVVYTFIWNMFNFPCGVVKFGTESGKNIDKYNVENDMVLRTAKKATKSSVGMPITVQLVALPFQEELVLRGMQELESLYEAHT